MLRDGHVFHLSQKLFKLEKYPNRLFIDLYMIYHDFF